MRHSGIIFALLLAVSPAAGRAAEAVVENPATPVEGVKTAVLTEQWRTGGEDSDVIFGNISASEVDPDGNVLLLDSQLSQVTVIGPDGEIVRTLGREGDGPGEVRGPGDMLLAQDGTLCLLQSFPGRIVKLHPDGTPAGDSAYTPAGGGQGQFAVLVTGLPHPDGMVLAGIRMSFAGTGRSVQDYFLSRCDSDGHELAQLLTKQSVIDYSDFELSEKGMDFIWSRCATAPDGTIYAAADRNAYRIEAWKDRDANPALAFTREAVVPERNADQRDVARKILEGVGANYPVPPQRLVTEDTPQVIAGMACTDDGLLWVLPSPGINTTPAGCWAVLDVFDSSGKFLRQVAVPGDYDPMQDQLTVLADGRILVTVGALDAFLNQQAVAGDEANQDAEPLEVICYDMKLQ